MLTSSNPSNTESRAISLTYKKIILRLIPFIFICNLFSYLDRVNVGFAKLKMLDALGFSETVYGLGAGIFFIGYVSCGVPSSLALMRFGPRRWIAILMITWGTLSASLAFVSSPIHFYLLRLLTGAAEAGFFPGVLLYLSHWFPEYLRGRIIALYMSAIPISGVFGGPFSGWILENFDRGYGDLSGWQWMFLLQGIPTLFLGILCFFLLTDNFKDAKWISPEEKDLITKEHTIFRSDIKSLTSSNNSFIRVLQSRYIWSFSIIYFSIQSGVYAINFWLPSIISNLGFDNTLVIGWLTAIPYLLAFIFMLLVGRSADYYKERYWHFIIPILMGSMGLVLSVQAMTSPIISIMGLVIACMGLMTSLPMFWAIISPIIPRINLSSASGLAFINSVGQIAGFASPYSVGVLKDTTGSTNLSLYILSAVILTGSLIASFTIKKIESSISIE